MSTITEGMIHLLLLAALLLVSCHSERPFPKVVLGPDAIQPLWSRYVGCSGGIAISLGRVSVARRVGREYESWLFDATSGRMLNVAVRPSRISSVPIDTLTELTAGTVKSLDRGKTGGVTPPGFSPVVLTDRFLFAKRSRTRFGRFRFYSEGQVVVIDLPSGNAVWTDSGFDIAIVATADRIIVCHDAQTSAFAANAGRPSEISEFYAAIRAADANKVRRLYPVFRKSGLLDVDGEVPLSVAAKNGSLDTVQLLIRLGESPNAVDADGFAPLMMALHWDHEDVAGILLDAGAIPNDDGPLWGSALRIAARGGQSGIIRHLLRSGAKIDFVEDWSGRTALHEAVMYRNYEAIETLISAGANKKVRDKDGKMPGELAQTDQCVIHLFAGGLIREKEAICQPVKRGTVAIKDSQTRH